MRKPPPEVAEYFKNIEAKPFRDALKSLREIILDEVPEAIETISYQIPTYKFNKTSVSIAAFKNHCSFFPGSTLTQFANSVEGFKTSRGTIQFTPDKPIPEKLVRKILKARFFGK